MNHHLHCAHDVFKISKCVIEEKIFFLVLVCLYIIIIIMVFIPIQS